MRKSYLIVFLFVSISILSQNKQILYNFTSVPQSLMVNPGADVKYKFYFGVPFLSGISANIGSSGFSAYDLFANNNIDFNTKLRNVVFSTSRNDKLALNEQLEIINGGFRVGDWQNKAYVSFGLYQEFDFLSYMPKDLAILALDGNKDYIGKVFNLGDLNFKTEMLSVLHFGYHKNLNDNFILGGRAKIYSSGFNATSTNNSGYVFTIPSTTTVYQQEIYSDMQVNTSGISNYWKDDYDGEIGADIKKKTLFGGNLGLGFDLGFSYYPKENIQFTASILDVGVIKHNKEVESFSYKGFYNYEGKNPLFRNGNGGGSSYDEFRDAVPFDTIYSNYTTWRPVKVHASYQYSFDDSRGYDCNCTGDKVDFKNAVGAQLFMMTTPRTPLMALTAYYRRNLLDNLHLKATYTLDSFSYTNLGMGFSGKIGAFNMYFMADNLLEYKDVSKSNGFSFQFGLNFVFKDKEGFY